jgi:hypothetical protein
MRLLGKVPTKTLAQSSIALNVVHIGMTLSLPHLLLPTKSVAFPMAAQVLIWIEFFLAFIVFLRPIDVLIAARAYPPSDVENVSITSIEEPEANRSLPTATTWIWSVLTLLSFLLLVLFLLHEHPPKM